MLDKILQKEVELEPIRATIDEEGCSGCRICNTMCPFSAIAYIDDLGVSRINPALCQGCGTCVASCPSGSIVQHLFEDEEIFSEIEGVLAYE